MDFGVARRQSGVDKLIAEGHAIVAVHALGSLQCNRSQPIQSSLGFRPTVILTVRQASSRPASMNFAVLISDP